MMNNILLKVSIVISALLMANKIPAQSIDGSLELKVAVAKQKLNTSSPTRLDPLALNAKLVWSDNNDQLAIVMKVSLLTDWHVYSSVSRKSPFIATEIKLALPEEGLMPLGEWEKPYAESYNEQASVYRGDELFFVRYYGVARNLRLDGKLKCGLYYQACDPYKCFPPKTKMVDLTD